MGFDAEFQNIGFTEDKSLGYVFGSEGVLLVYETNPSTIKYSSQGIKSFHLFQNYPNPFNPSTKISFTLPSVSHVNLEVYNILGELVSTLVNERLEEGYHSVNYTATNSLPTGIYIYRLNVGGAFVSQKKMILLK